MSETGFRALNVLLAVIVIATFALTLGWHISIQKRVEQTTLVQRGHVLWAMTDDSTSYPGGQCEYARINQAIIDNPGVGYSVGDLIVGLDTGYYLQSFVYRVTSVDEETGAVLTYDVLNPGCMQQNQNVTVTTMSAGGGVNFTVIVNADGTANPNDLDGAALYRFDMSPVNLIAPLINGTYSLYTVNHGGADVYVLQIDPPPVPLAIQDTHSHTGIRVFLYGFNATIRALFPLGDWEVSAPLTPSGLAAFSFADDADCVATGTDCMLGAYYPTNYEERDAYSYGQNAFSINNQVYWTPYIMWAYGSISGAFDYAANHGSFTLLRPWTFFLRPV